MSNFYGHVMLGLRIHFLYFIQPNVSKICSFINLCIHPSPFRASGKISQRSPFGCTHTFFSKTSYDQRIFLQRKVGNHLFSKARRFLARQLISSFSTFFLTCSLFFLLALFFLFFIFIFIMIFVCFIFWTMFLNEELYMVPEFQTSLIVMIYKH